MKIFEEDYITPNVEDDDEMLLIKEAITKLNGVQRKIYLSYVVNGTYTATAQEFGVSIPTIKTYINNINGIIRDYIFDNIFNHIFS